MPKPTPFRCPVCGCTSYELHQRPAAKLAYSCHGCSLLFLDPEKFIRLGKPQPPERRGNVWGPAWQRLGRSASLSAEHFASQHPASVISQSDDVARRSRGLLSMHTIAGPGRP